MIIINHNSIIENFEHFFSGLIRSTQNHFFLKWFLNVFMNYIQFKRALQQSYLKFIRKVEKILKGSLDSIRSPPVKIQIMGRKVCLRCNRKTLLGMSTNFWKQKRQAFTPQANFSAHNLNFHWRWRLKVMGSNPDYLLKYFLLYDIAAEWANQMAENISWNLCKLDRHES